MCRSVPQMVTASTRTIASVAAVSPGSAWSAQLRRPGPSYTSAFMASPSSPGQRNGRPPVGGRPWSGWLSAQPLAVADEGGPAPAESPRVPGRGGRQHDEDQRVDDVVVDDRVGGVRRLTGARALREGPFGGPH